MKIIFFGTPEFAVASLQKLADSACHVVAVVTAPDKPAGRGLHLTQSPVKKYALEKNIPVLQPQNLKDENFLAEIKSLDADVFMVVAFRMMPEVLWQMPQAGTFNLHASLLPQYRGAAPINHAIINGETETGLTTFFIQHQIDTGNIILQEKISIGGDETAGQLHDRLKQAGAELVLETVRMIETGQVKTINQKEFLHEGEEIKTAPKIFKEHCKINWANSVHAVYNLIRGLSPHPTAFTELTDANGEELGLKIFSAEKEIAEAGEEGMIFSDGKTFFKISCAGGFISIKELQLSGKKRMGVEEFLRGIKINNYVVKK